MSKAVLFPKYVVRCDLSVCERFRLANLITYFSVHGMISRLSDKYNVSRQFLHDLKKDFASYEQNYCRSGGKPSKLDEKADIVEQILSLRLECKSSIEGISSHLSRFGATYSSVGFISGVLKTVGGSTRFGIAYCWSGYKTSVLQRRNI
jgi:transposase